MTQHSENSNPSLINMASHIPKDMKISRVDHLPITSAWCRKIGLAQIVNNLAPTQMNVDVGTIVVALVLDTLSGRSPLYRLSEFYEHLDIPLLIGKDLPPEAFNDSNVGRALDRIYEAGTTKIFTQIALEATQVWNVKASYVHYDTTSVNVWGDYRSGDEDVIETENGPVVITYGHSKDHRPDLKQVVVECLCISRNIPIYGACADGNASDKTLNNKLLSQLTEIMARRGLEPGAYIYVVDSAFVTKANLDEIGENLFITRLPFNYNVTDEAVAQAVERNQWTEVGPIAMAQSTPNRPVAEYRVCETSVVLYDKSYRAIVVHSSSHDKRRHKRLDRDIAKARQQLDKDIAEACSQSYFCEADAQAAGRRLAQQVGPWHRIQTSVVERPRYARGRPRHDKPRTVEQMLYALEARVEENTGTIEGKRAEAGCFVLLSNVPSHGELAHSPEEILRAYKEQHGIERNFSFLKDPLIVNDLFLKDPRRIEALGMILLISLLIWNLMERSLRQSIKEGGEELPGWKRRTTDRPTAFMMATKFSGITIIRVGDTVQLTRPLNKIQQIYLKALCLDLKDFLNLSLPRSPG